MSWGDLIKLVTNYANNAIVEKPIESKEKEKEKKTEKPSVLTTVTSTALAFLVKENFGEDAGKQAEEFLKEAAPIIDKIVPNNPAMEKGIKLGQKALPKDADPLLTVMMIGAGAAAGYTVGEVNKEEKSDNNKQQNSASIKKTHNESQKKAEPPKEELKASPPPVSFPQKKAEPPKEQPKASPPPVSFSETKNESSREKANTFSDFLSYDERNLESPADFDKGFLHQFPINEDPQDLDTLLDILETELSPKSSENFQNDLDTLDKLV